MSRWHSSLAHPSFKALAAANTAYKLGITREQLKRIESYVCVHCLNGKARRTGIGKVNASRNHPPVTRALDRFHSDLCGPVSIRVNGQTIRVRAFGNYLYYMLVIDEATDYWWGFLLQVKSDAVSKLRDLLTHLKTQFERSVKELHTDGGGEYVNTVLENYCRANGIMHTYTTAHHPEHNPRAENSNGKTNSGIRSMLSESGAPSSLWGAAFLHYVYIHNRLPTVATPRSRSKAQSKGTQAKPNKPDHTFASPYKKLLGRDPDMSKHHPFGCNAHIVIPKQERGKLNMLTRPGIYLGVDHQQNCYIILDPVTLKYHYTRDVKFDEDSYSHMAMLRKGVVPHPTVSIDNYWDVLQSGSTLEDNCPDLSDSDDDELDDSVSHDPHSASDNESQADPLDLPTIDHLSPIHSDAEDAAVNDDVIELDSSAEREEFPEHWSHGIPNTVTHDYSDMTLDDPALSPPLTDDEQEEKYNDPPTAYAVADAGHVPASLPPIDPAPLCSDIEEMPVTYDYETDDFHVVHPVFAVSLDDSYSLFPLFAMGVLDVFVPRTWKQAMACKDRHQWKEALDAEVESLRSRGVYSLVELPPGKRAIGCLWVMTVKHDSEGNVSRY